MFSESFLKKFLTVLRIIIAAIAFSVFVLIVYACSDQKFSFETEYGDVFHGYCDMWGDYAELSCPDHNLDLSFSSAFSKNDITPVCDTEHFRCYKFHNGIDDDFYICGLKPDGDYFPIDPDEKVTPEFFKEKYGEDFKKVFLADTYIMKITLYYMGGCYHSTMLNIAEKLIAKDYEGLEKYGLTQEMINDKESLKEKTKIMYDYLDRSKGVYKNERFAS